MQAVCITLPAVVVCWACLPGGFAGEGVSTTPSPVFAPAQRRGAKTSVRPLQAG